MSQQTPQQQVVAKCHQLFARVQELYGLNLSSVGIAFDLKGRAAGMACRRGGYYKIRFNHDMLGREAFDHLLNDTVPHEIAHIVCFMDKRLGRNHDLGWARVCRALGGSGDRCHEEEVVFGKGTTYEYTTDAGHKVRMSDKHHRYVQGGSSLRYKHGKGTVLAYSAYAVVGLQGRSITPRHMPGRAQPTAQPTAQPVAHVSTAPAVKRTPFLNEERARPAPQAQPEVQTEGPWVLSGATAMAIASAKTKAEKARAVMADGMLKGVSEQAIIKAISNVTGHNMSLSKAYYAGNLERVRSVI